MLKWINCYVARVSRHVLSTPRKLGGSISNSSIEAFAESKEFRIKDSNVYFNKSSKKTEINLLLSHRLLQEETDFIIDPNGQAIKAQQSTKVTSFFNGYEEVVDIAAEDPQTLLGTIEFIKREEPELSFIDLKTNETLELTGSEGINE